MSKTSIHIIGLGIGSPAELSASSRKALLESEVIVGSKRQYDLLEKSVIKDQAFFELPKFPELSSLLARLDHKNLAILASGDPLYFGIGRWFSQNYDSDRLSFHPAVSSIQVACHRLGLALQDANVISLHGRSLKGLRRHLRQNQTLIVLTDDQSTPAAIARECTKAGFPNASLTICENLGYADERIHTLQAADLESNNATKYSALNVCVIQTGIGSHVCPEFPGFDDTWFVTDGAPGQGMISKREVRLGILSLLQPANDDVIWDLGAGCGGVATELAYWNESVAVYAVEQNVQRLQCLAANRDKFGVVSNLHIIEGRVPAALESLPSANKVFIGGSDGELSALLTGLWQNLPETGLLVASAVTETSFQILDQFTQTLNENQVETIQYAVSRGIRSGNHTAFHAKRPVTLFKFCKFGLVQ